MSDNISNDGTRDLFASYRQVAWHGLGNVFEEPITDYREMLNAAGLSGWNVRKEALQTVGGILVPGQYATVRDVINENGVSTVPMGVVGERYETIQNEMSFALLQTMADGATWETAGALGNGSKVFGSIAFERDIVLDPTGVADVVKSYGLTVNSHDGTTPFMFKKTNVRVVCANTLGIALAGAGDVVKIRHTATAEARANEAARIWREAAKYDDVFEAEAQALYAASITDKQYENLFNTLFTKPDGEGAPLTRWENKRGLYMQAWNGAPNAGIKGTAWGAWNALTEANQWGRGMRDSDKGREAFFSAGAGLDGPTNKFRADSFALVKARAGVK